MNISEALLHALKDRGVGQVFGIPGDFALPFFAVLEKSAILPLYTLSHEPAVGFAADAAARVNCTLGAAAVTYGAGAFNIVNAVTAAYAEKCPLVVISGAPGADESARGLLLHHQGKALDSQYKVFTNITCAQARLDDADTAPTEIGRVLDTARQHSLPAYIELPRDMANVSCQPVSSSRATPVDTDALAACAEEVLARLSDASSPVLMAGVELRRYRLEDKVAELARRLDVPVVTSFMGRGLLAHSDLPALGTYLGVAGEPGLTQLVENSDGLLLLGVIPSDTNFGVSARQINMGRAIHAFNRQVKLGYHVYHEMPLADLIDGMLARVEARSHSRAPTNGVLYPRGLTADDNKITPTDIARAINDLMGAHGLMPIASDVGDCLFTAMEIAQTDLIAPGYYAGMGYGVPAGMGLQIATGNRPLILVGDGAFQMTGWELGNCQRYRLDPIVIVFNNASWEMLRVLRPECKFNDLDEWHFADMAVPLGGTGVRVATRKQLQQALDRATHEGGKFFLIEAMIERGEISDILRRYLKGLSRKRPSKG
ncbi:MAG: indolepyruvate/phenylpyruvate decarboxylase [Gammaproteobacteria bacterium]|jgi:indolepyruvate decarboxylase|nr:indolepyruvate/phenylpyruvate decarboxylase [Gammaproteobacteria bacterium]